MRILTAIILALTLGFAHAGQITLTADDDFKLHGDYFAGKQGMAGVLMLHQCNSERSMYKGLGERLAAKGFHALSVDFRMYGDSVTDEINIDKIRAKAVSRQTSRSLIRKNRDLWPQDVLVAEQFLRNKIGKKAKLGVVGASCGGMQGVLLAKSKKVDALMFFSSGMNEKGQQVYHELGPLPTYIIAAQEDTFTYGTAIEIFVKAAHPQTKLISYKGRGHGYPLFQQDPHLADDMVRWFGVQLK